MIKYFELATQVMDLYQDVTTTGENAKLLHDLLELCLEDVNLDQLTNVYRYSYDASDVGFDLESVGEFAIKFKQTYPRPLDVENFEFDAFGDVYTNALKKILDKITHKELRSPKDVTIVDDNVAIDGKHIGKYSTFEAVRPGVLVYDIDKDDVNLIVNGTKELKSLLRAMLIYDRYNLKRPEMKSLKPVITEVIKEVEVGFKYKNTSEHKEALESLFMQVVDGTVSIPGVSSDVAMVSDDETETDTIKLHANILLDEVPVAEVDINGEEYTIGYLLKGSELAELINQNPVLVKYVDLMISLLNI